jgi:hypothetical protein
MGSLPQFLRGKNWGKEYYFHAPALVKLFHKIQTLIFLVF